MKKVFLFILLICLFVSCGTNESLSLKETIGATEDQTTLIQEILERNEIYYSSIDVSNNPITKGMEELWEAYDLIDNKGSKYLLILGKSDKSFTAILDENNNIVEGMIDTGVLPKWFE